MNQYNEEIDIYIQDVLNQLQVLPRDSEKASMGRERYYLQVAELVKEQEMAHAVSNTPFQRLNEWKSTILYPVTRRGRLSMLVTFTTVLVAITMLFGGAGATVFAAQTSQPDELLFPVKTFSEDVRLTLTRNPRSQMDMLMTFTDRRMSEIASMLSAGEPIREAVAARFQDELNHMFRIANGLDDPSMIQALEHIAIHVRKHEREMERLRAGHPGQVDPVMDQVREMLRLRVHLAEFGINDPQAFRNQMQQLLRSGPGPLNQGEKANPDDGYRSRTGPVDEQQPCFDCSNDDEGSGFGPGPSNRGETTSPEDGYGPQDPQECNGCQEEGGSGEGRSDSNTTNQKEEPPSNKNQEQNSESNGDHSGGGSQQNGGQSNTNPRSGSSK